MKLNWSNKINQSRIHSLRRFYKRRVSLGAVSNQQAKIHFILIETRKQMLNNKKE